MAFILPTGALTPAYRVATRLDPAARIVRAADLAAYLQAEEIVAASHAQAKAIVQQAREEFASERKRGFDEGEEQARRVAAQHMAEQLLHTQEYLDRVESRVVDLVVQAMQRIIEGFDERDLAANAVRKALEIVRNQNHITVRVHPDHVEYIRAGTDALLAGYPGVDLLDVIGDARIARDAGVLESEIGRVEASASGQLSALQAAMRQVLGAPSNEQSKGG